MYSLLRVTSYPPLGQVTCLRNATLRFTVVIESARDEPWEAQIWQNIGSPEWSALPLRRDDSGGTSLSTGKDPNYTRHVFSQQISAPVGGGYARFTVQFREGPGKDWKWVNQEQHANDGELIFVSPTRTANLLTASGAEDFSEYFDDISSDVHIESRRSEAPGASLWHLSGSVESAEDGRSGTRHLVLGIPSSINKYFALARIWTPWLGPRQGKGKLALTEDAILCSILRIDGVHLVLLAVSGVDDVLTVLGSGENGEVVVKAQNDNAAGARFQILASAADDFEIAMSAVIYEARKLVRPYSAVEIPSEGGDKDPKAQWLSAWYDGLTYCTWNGIGQDLTEEKILLAVKDLKEHGIDISNLIIDDNWQTVDHIEESQWERAWKRFEANPQSFPQGLGKTVTAIRQENPSIQHIAVWHSLLGYWGGISPEGELAAKYKTKEVPIKDPVIGGTVSFDVKRNSVLAIDPDDVQHFYDDFYKFLSSADIDFVKTDSQYFLDLMTDPEDRRRFTTSYQDAWTLATLRHFGSKAISCMSLMPQTIFHSQLPTNKPVIPVRNSDDFFPDVEDSHAWHIFCNAHNALFTRYLNIIPDWDMFQTDHPYSSFHAAARCLSGGPISITDRPGHHNLELINQITAKTPRGTTVILRPSLVGRTLDMYHDIKEGHILRVGNYTGRARTGSGIIALFNVSPSTASCIIPLTDFPGIHTSDGSYIVRAHTSGKIAESMQPADSRAVVSTTLEKKGWEILTAYPTQSFTLKHGNNPASTQVAVLGLLGKMTGAAAVLTSDIYVESNGRLRFSVSLKALGTLGVYISDLRDWDIEKDFMVMILGKPVPVHTVHGDGKVLTVDIQTAWNEMGLEAGWSNEVRVEIFLH